MYMFTLGLFGWMSNRNESMWWDWCFCRFHQPKMEGCARKSGGWPFSTNTVVVSVRVGAQHAYPHFPRASVYPCFIDRRNRPLTKPIFSRPIYRVAPKSHCPLKLSPFSETPAFSSPYYSSSLLNIALRIYLECQRIRCSRFVYVIKSL